MKKLIYAILSFIKTIGIFCLWFLLTTLITISLSKLEKEYYTPTDTPNERFMVGGQRWQDFQKSPKPIITEPYGDCMETCLKILDNGNYLYINESPLVTTESEYQIKDGKVIPVSYKTFNAGQMLTAMFLAFLMLSFLKYLYAIYQIRKDKTALIAYHKKLGRELLIFVGIVGIGWGLMWWSRA